jgi:hypothetical protein
MGLGRRTFAPGEVLTASNVMNYLQDQAVMNFAGTAARGSAIGTAVSEGMITYLNDSNLLEAYDGSAWKQIASTTGSVLQVVSGTKSDTFSATLSPSVLSNITGLSVSITPKSTSSRILIFTHIHVSNSGDGISLALKRNTTYIGTGNADGSRQVRTMYANPADNITAYRMQTASMTFLDSPATTSSTTYTVDLSTALAGISRVVYVNRTQNDDNATTVPRTISTITAMEIAN